MPNADSAGNSLDVALLLSALTAFKKGDFTVRLPLDWTGVAGKVADTFNDVIETNERLSNELSGLSHAVGKEGKLGQRISIGDVTGAWANKVNAVNTLLEDLARPVTETARVIAAVAKGDLSQSMSLESDGQPLQGNFLQTAQTINTMVAQLNSFSLEVSRVAREVGTEGKLGGQAEVAGMAGTWKDLTDKVNSMSGNVSERKQAQEALRESEEMFRTLVERVPQLVWACNPDGLNVYFNQRWVDYTGLTLEESYGRGWNTPFHPDDKQPAWDAWNHAVATGETYRIDCRLRAADGSYRWFLIKGVPRRDANGVIVKWFGTCTDINDAKQAELRIARQNAVLNAVNMVFREALSSQDEASLWRKCLAIGQTLTGAKFGFIDELNADGRLDTLALSDPGWDACAMPAAQASLLIKNIEVRGIYAPTIREGRSVLTNDPSSCPGWFGLPEGHPPLTSFLGVPLKQGAKMIGVIGVANRASGFVPADQEDLEMLAVSVVEALMRKRAEHEIRRLNDELEQRVIQRTAQLQAANQELEAFSYSVSHDLRAPLRHISGFSKILVEQYASTLPPDARHCLERIEEGTHRMGRLVDDLLDLARVGRRDVNLKVAGLRSLVEETIRVLEPDWVDRQVEWKISELPYVECDTALIGHVFQNLLSNALKFTRPRSQAVIEVGQVDHNGVPAIYVHDNGVGFSMKYADKLFGVFQRLHRAEDFEGTGVGLATVQRIIQKHGGRIWADAELDKGATFYFTLGNHDKERTESQAAIGANA